MNMKTKHKTEFGWTMHRVWVGTKSFFVRTIPEAVANLRWPWLKAGRCCSWYYDIPKGWRKAFGKEMAGRVQKLVNAHIKAMRKRGIKVKSSDVVSVAEVKEKWGQLRVGACAPNGILDVIEYYENASWDYCVFCGRPANYQTTGWILPVCEKHRKGHPSKRKEED